MLSSILHNKILHSILFPHEPLYLLPFKFSGLHNFCPNLDKLSARSHKCVLLGFTRYRKGYKSFSHSLNRYFIFAYVTFIESSFYFKSLSSPLVSPSNQVHISIVFDPLVASSVPIYSPPPPPFQVYSCHQTSHHPPIDSLLIFPLPFVKVAFYL